MTQGDQVLICALAHVDLVELVGYSADFLSIETIG